jgi:hypothetical protein
MKLTPGVRLRSALSDLEVIVVRAPADELELTAGGAPMLSHDESSKPPSEAAPAGEEVQLGKRYADDESGIEVLCTRAGSGPLAVDGRPLELQEAKPLPSSD